LETTIHVERAKKRWSQTDLAKKVFVTRQTIHAIERGKKKPSVELAIRIARVLDSSVEELFHLE